MRARRTRADQRLILIAETQWYPAYGDAGVAPEQMATVAANYIAAARADGDVVAVLGYLWPGGLDAPDQRGARELPTSVRATLRDIGHDIAGK